MPPVTHLFCQILSLRVNTVVPSQSEGFSPSLLCPEIYTKTQWSGVNTGLHMAEERNTCHHRNYPFIFPNYPPNGDTRLFKIPLVHSKLQQDTESETESQSLSCYLTVPLSKEVIL